MSYNEDLDPPPPHDISNVFASVDLSYQSSYDTVKYKCAWHRAKGIHSSILSTVCAWTFPRKSMIEYNNVSVINSKTSVLRVDIQ